ncbi:MAG TPA: AAA family ATPase, partial [Dongiaceae bacterium]
RHAGLIEQRRCDGFVRQCHGDLHLGNICLIDEKPVLFDCIDFSEMISCIDVAYDLAFVLMDLCHRQRPDLANIVLNRWLDRSGDKHGLTLMPFFMSLRAAIRAHILATSHRDEEAVAYLVTAAKHLMVASPCLIAIGGLSGSGKSTLAQLLAPDFHPLPGARVIRSDTLRKRLAGVAPETCLPASSYNQDMSHRIYVKLLAEAQAALDAGHSVILDAAFLRPQERDHAAALAASLKVPFHGIWLDVPIDILKARIAARHDDASDADLQVLDHQLSLDLGTITWHRMLASADTEAISEELRRVLGMPSPAVTS